MDIVTLALAKKYADEKLTNVKVDLTGYAKEDYVDDEIEELNKKIVQETGKLSNEIAELNGDLSKYECKNLIGMRTDFLYPVFLKAGTTLTMSTHDGSVLSTYTNLELYDNDKVYFDSFTFIGGTNHRTITLPEDVGYMKWDIGTIPLQLELGGEVTGYVEYSPSFKDTVDNFINEHRTRFGKNLIGMDNILYPVFLKKGTTITMSTFDGAKIPIGQVIDLELFNNNGDCFGTYRFLDNTTYRTITITKDVSYVRWKLNGYSEKLQLELGDIPTNYQEYRDGLLTDIDKINNNAEMKCKNLIGMDINTLYPVNLHIGDTVTMSTSDGSNINSLQELNINMYDSNGSLIDAYTFFNGTNKRTIVLSKDVHYINWNQKYDTPLQLETGTVATSYVEYYIDNKSIAKKVEDNKKNIKSNDNFIVGNKEVSVYNPYKNKKNNAYKGQLHCHTTNSDGRFSVDTLMSKYSEAGYDFIAITDHNYITEEPTNLHGMVWLGNSLEDTRNVAGYQHCNIFGATSVIGKTDIYITTNTVRSMVNDYVKGQGCVMQYNHPEDIVVKVSDYDLLNMPIGNSLIEIYNGCDIADVKTVQNYSDLPSSGSKFNTLYYVSSENKKYRNINLDGMSNTWEVTDRSPVDQERAFSALLDNGYKIFGTATDDCHGDNTFNYGWIITYANSKTKTSIWDSILKGNFYASCGVEIENIDVSEGFYNISIANGTNAITTFYGANRSVLKTCNGSFASYEFDGSEKYVRATIVINDKKAWTQPVWVLGSKYNYEF